MKKQYIVLIVISIITVLGCTVAYYSDWYNPVSAAPPKLIYSNKALLAEANRLRAEKGVKPLVIDERLNQSAQWKADDMARNNYFGHTKPGETTPKGVKMSYDVMVDANGSKECLRTAENIHANPDYHSPFGKAGENHGWTNSKPHYEAEIDINLEVTGFAYAQGNGYIYYVQHFCDLN